MDLLSARPSGDCCGLLSLSLELRHQIYSYLIPCTYRDDRSNLMAWRRGNIKLLTINKQIYAEVVDMMYGDTTFFLEVDDGSVTFRCTYPSCRDGIFIRERLSFPDTIAAKYIAQMRNLHVQIFPSYDAQRSPVQGLAPTAEAPASAAKNSKPSAAPGRMARGTFAGPQTRSMGNEPPSKMHITRPDGKWVIVKMVDRQMEVLLSTLTQMNEILHLQLQVERRNQPRVINQRLGMWYENPCLLAPLLKLENISRISLGGYRSEEVEEALSDNSAWSVVSSISKASSVQLSRRSGCGL